MLLKEPLKEMWWGKRARGGTLGMPQKHICNWKVVWMGTHEISSAYRNLTILLAIGSGRVGKLGISFSSHYSILTSLLLLLLLLLW